MSSRTNYHHLTKDFQDRYLFTKIHGKIFKKKILSFDTETHNNNQTFTLGTVYDGTQYYEFFDEQGKKDMKKLLIDTRHQNTVICATNLQFDFSAIVDVNEFSKYLMIQKGGRYISIKKKTKYENKKHKGHDTVFVNKMIDSLNHFGLSVAKAGKMLGIEKMDAPYNLGQEPSKTKIAKAVRKVEDKNGKEYEEEYEIQNMTEHEYLLEYNRRDTLITYKLMEFLQNAYNEFGCEMKDTLSSTSLDLLKRKYLPCDMIKEEYTIGDEAIKAKIFKCYYGGRTEVFGRGRIKSKEGDKWVVGDFNSLYPSTMLNKFPLPQSIQGIMDGTINNIKEYEGFSDVSIECDYMYYPFLPYRDEDMGKLIFPIGRWRASYTHIELRKAIELGYRILEIHEQHIYTETFYPFKEFITEMYGKRLEFQKIKSAMEQVTKILMNGSYGKFAEREHREYDWFNIEEMTRDEFKIFIELSNTMILDKIGYTIITKECQSNHVFPIISAYVTSYGRIKIYDAIVKYKAVFCDTDSVITNMSIQHSTELGELKIEDELSEFVIIKPKLYMKIDMKGKTKVKFKGVPNATIESFEKVLQHDKVYYNKFTKPNESIRTGYGINSVHEVSKSVDLEDNKRVWKHPFSTETFDRDSEPIRIDKLTIKPKKAIKKRTMKEKLLALKKAQAKAKKFKLEVTDTELIQQIIDEEKPIDYEEDLLEDSVDENDESDN